MDFLYSDNVAGRTTRGALWVIAIGGLVYGVAGLAGLL